MVFVNICIPKGARFPEKRLPGVPGVCPAAATRCRSIVVLLLKMADTMGTSAMTFARSLTVHDARTTPLH